MANLFCENCGTNLAAQEGFNPSDREHKCKACGSVTISKNVPASDHENDKKSDDDWKRPEVNPLIHEEFRPLTRIERERKERLKINLIFWGSFALYTILGGILFFKLIGDEHPVICTLIAVIFILLLFGKYLYDEVTGNRPAGFASSEAIGRDVDEVAARLEDNGFTCIDTLELNDLTPSEKEKEDSVVTVTIKGESTFTATKRFSYKSKIIITHHSMKKTHTPVASSNIGEWRYDDLAQAFTGAGFVNVKTIPGNDLNIIKGLISKPDMVYRVIIDDVEKFTEESAFPIDANVEIVYHSAKNKE